ncbi:MAG TPA: 50S ribosomal protein L18 [Lacipirellulaceae bacterium]|nr:50S ribosomal protein L18 [Lacipirellulaceae bacterium]
MDHFKKLGRLRTRRAFRVRKRIRGTPERPRLSVVRSHKHISAQLIDDLAGKTVAAASSQDKQLSGKLKSGGNRDAAQAVGKAIAERAIATGVKAVAFDRGPYRYHGRVADLANAAREAGLSF